MVLNRLREKFSAREQQQQQQQLLPEDCLGCRLVGVGTFSGLSAYALYQQRQIPKTRVLHRVTVGIMSAAFFSVAVVRAVI
jgi:hypothetical protein